MPVSDAAEVALRESAVPSNTKATTEWGIRVCTEGYSFGRWSCSSYNATAGDSCRRFGVLDGEIRSGGTQERR